VRLLNSAACLPDYIRVSAGSAVVLGLLETKLDVAPTTAYLMTYREQKCNANCGFCPQARESSSRTDMLSRVSWPTYPTNQVIERIGAALERRQIERVCIQALNYPEVFSHLVALVAAVFSFTRIPISVSCQPMNREEMVLLVKAGTQRIGIPLDAATREVFDRVKGFQAGGPYDWEKQMQVLRNAIEVFGKGMVSTHLIVGIGETEKEMVKAVQDCVDMGIAPGLFAFTPVCGTALESNRPPNIGQYRRIQLARYFILHKISRCENMNFDENRLTNFGVNEQTLSKIIETGEPFLTSGCPGCNRPYYNERPGGTMYNYPAKLTQKQVFQVKNELGF
jgi:biotin synthase-related radical SAM superfamily protein